MKRCVDNRLVLAFPACGGYVGYFGYELRSDCGSPVTHPSPYPDARADAAPQKTNLGPVVESFGATGKTSLPRPRLSPIDYLDRIRQCVEYIRAGEVYELCLTNQLGIRIGYYLALRLLRESAQTGIPRLIPAYLRFGEHEIACSSPECFLRIDRSVKWSRVL